MAGFTIDITGRIKNFDIPRNQPLVPLYEAIVNSIHAIEERRAHDDKSFNPYITIEICARSAVNHRGPRYRLQY